jgi:hypothetical protein
MTKKTYEVLNATSVVNLSNESVKQLAPGQEVEGEFVLIDDKPYIEVEGGYVNMTDLAEKLDASDIASVESEVKGSNKKLIFALVGAGVGYAVAHYLKKDLKMKVVFTIGGLVAGLFAEHINQKRK